MNPFEQYTLIIGVLAVLMEGFSYLRSLLRKILRSNSHSKHHI
jgi:hypothetical protein